MTLTALAGGLRLGLLASRLADEKPRHPRLFERCLSGLILRELAGNCGLSAIINTDAFLQGNAARPDMTCRDFCTTYVNRVYFNFEDVLCVNAPGDTRSHVIPGGARELWLASISC